jgi:hypothetical protein
VAPENHPIKGRGIVVDKKMKQQQSKSEYGTMTAKFDANGEYGSSSSSSAQSNAAGSQQSSKAKYGTLTAKADANNDYE